MAVNITPRYSTDNQEEVKEKEVAGINEGVVTSKNSSVTGLAYDNRWMIAGIIVVVLIIVVIAWWLKNKEGLKEGSAEKEQTEPNKPQTKKNIKPKDDGTQQPTQNTQQPVQNAQQYTQQPMQQYTQQPTQNAQQYTQQYTQQPTQNTQQSTQQPTQITQQPTQQPAQNTQQNPVSDQKVELLTMLQNISTTKPSQVSNSKTDDDILKLMEDVSNIETAQNNDNDVAELNTTVQTVSNQSTMELDTSLCTAITAQGVQCTRKPRSNNKCHSHGG